MGIYPVTIWTMKIILANPQSKNGVNREKIILYNDKEDYVK